MDGKDPGPKCPSCYGTLEPYSGLFDSDEVGGAKWRYEEGWHCLHCWSSFDKSDVPFTGDPWADFIPVVQI